MKYQHGYSEHFPAVTDRATRARKAVKIRQVLEDFLGHDLNGLTCLDLGCSVGVIAEELARSARLVTGLDIDAAALKEAAKQPGGRGRFLLADGGAAPFADATFDVIVCSQVYEHSPDVPALVSEIYRLLKDDGVCFFSGPNRWAVMERHYNLPFLSWLPQPLADRYVRAAGKAEEYYEHPCSAGELRRALRRFTIHDYTAKLVTEPGRFAMEQETGQLSRVLARMPAWAWRLAGELTPNFNWVLTKHG